MIKKFLYYTLFIVLTLSADSFSSEPEVIINYDINDISTRKQRREYFTDIFQMKYFKAPLLKEPWKQDSFGFVMELLIENTYQHNKYEDKRASIGLRESEKRLFIRFSNPFDSDFPKILKNKTFPKDFGDFDNPEDYPRVPEEQRNQKGTVSGIAIKKIIQRLDQMIEDNEIRFFETIDNETGDKIFNVEFSLPFKRENCPLLMESFLKQDSKSKISSSNYLSRWRLHNIFRRSKD